MTRARIAMAALAYAALVAHLLFIPYVFSPLPFDEALRRFSHIPWMHLGSEQNVALVSRGLMFLPLGLLLATWVAPQPRRWIELPALFVAGLFGCFLAAGVNFAQLWFPARTVSLNNLVAECSGVIGGGLLWCTLGAAGLRWRRKLASGGHASLEAVLGGYVLLYLLWSLMPFDFVTSSEEMAEKAASNLYGLWIAPVGCGKLSCAFKFAIRCVAAVPCGWWIAARRAGASRIPLAGLLAALAAATIIELLHFLMISEVSQGASIFFRTLGVALGTSTYAWRHYPAALDLHRVVRPVVLVLAVPYLIVVAYAGGWFRSRPVGIAEGVARLGDAVVQPFYYVYYNAYADSIDSLLVHAALYAPVGLLCWAWAQRRDHVRLWLATLLAALLALVTETSKVFLADRLPDYTDVFIAGVSATLTLAIFRLASWGQRSPRNSLAVRHSETVR